MNNQSIESQFREGEITLIKHWDEQRQEWTTSAYPRISGRLRLVHSENDALSIDTEIIKYDENIAMVSAISVLVKAVSKE